MPKEWGVGVEDMDAPQRARIIADYIAGMTDRYARREWKRIGGVL